MMGTHETHDMHENSMRAWEQFDMSDREQDVCRMYTMHEWLTDRQVCTKLGSKDLNYVRPSITGLIHAGTVVEHPDKAVCETTGRHVRKCRIAQYPRYEKEGERCETHAGVVDKLTKLVADIGQENEILKQALEGIRRAARNRPRTQDSDYYAIVDILLCVDIALAAEGDGDE